MTRRQAPEISPVERQAEMASAYAELRAAAAAAEITATTVGRLARSARAGGASWSEIALQCGCTVQAAVARWGPVRGRTRRAECCGQAWLFEATKTARAG